MACESKKLLSDALWCHDILLNRLLRSYFFEAATFLLFYKRLQSELEALIDEESSDLDSLTDNVRHQLIDNTSEDENSIESSNSNNDGFASLGVLVRTCWPTPWPRARIQPRPRRRETEHASSSRNSCGIEWMQWVMSHRKPCNHPWWRKRNTG